MSITWWIAPGEEARVEAAGLRDFETVFRRGDLVPVKDVLVERQVHRWPVETGEPLFLKRQFRCPGSEGAVSRAKREKDALLLLRDLEIPAPRPVVMAEERRLGRVRRAFLATEALPLKANLQDALTDGLDGRRRANLLREIAEILKTMHAAGLNHRDFYLGHLFLMDADGPRGESLAVLDLDRAQIRRKVPLRWRIKDLAALLVSAPEGVISSRERLRFFRAYLDGPLRDHRRWIELVERRVARTRARIARRITQGRANHHLP